MKLFFVSRSDACHRGEELAIAACFLPRVTGVTFEQLTGIRYQIGGDWSCKTPMKKFPLHEFTHNYIFTVKSR